MTTLAVATGAPRRNVLRYYGGKWRLAPWILSHFPPHRCYVEPYGGSGAVLFRKKPSIAEVYNDISGDMVCFFRVLRERPRELIRAIELTPFSRREFDLASERSGLDEVECARRVYVRCCQGRGGLKPNRTGWRHCRGVGRSSTVADEFASVEHLWAAANRLRTVQIEHDSALAVVRRYDTPHTLFYLDPPYPKKTRSKRCGRDGYAAEMTDDDHVEMLAAAKNVAGLVVISGYRCELYDRELAGWTRRDLAARCDLGSAVESLWLSPRAEHGGLLLVGGHS